MILTIDLETYSSVDITKSNVYRYVDADDFQILLFGYAIDDGEVTVIDVTEHPIPPRICKLITDPDVIKVAYNANFERVCLSRYLIWETIPASYGTFLDPAQWRCTMVHAMSTGLPRSLEQVGRVLGLGEGKAKLKDGKALIQYFCKPCKPTKANGGRTRNYPEHDRSKWARFIEYNKRDVEVERTIRNILEAKPVIDREWEAWFMDQRINDRGCLLDKTLVENAIKVSQEHTDALTQEAVAITGLDNVNSISQLKSWLGVEGSLDKKAVKSLRETGGLDLRQDRMLAIRQELGKTSVSKYEAMERGVCYDGRVRGLFQFYGANRTGRWAGRQVQVQNLPQNHISDLDLARDILREGDRECLQLLYGNVPDILSQLIRTAFIAGAGKVLCVADFSAIEARVIAWLSGERWRMEVFRSGGDIYCASASQMFHVPVEKHGVNGHLRQKGKIAELALGYGGSVGALEAMGALDMGLQREELKPLVDKWRVANPMVTQFWWDVDRVVRAALNSPGSVQQLPCAMGKTAITVQKSNKLLNLQLPSGRCIRYWEPMITIDPVTGRDNITYGGMDAGVWGRLETYGPKLVENIVQATARDCLRDAMLRVEKRYPEIVMHVHDEMIVEVPEEEAETALSYMQDCMGDPFPWADGLLLRGDGYVTKYYRKD